MSALLSIEIDPVWFSTLNEITGKKNKEKEQWKYDRSLLSSNPWEIEPRECGQPGAALTRRIRGHRQAMQQQSSSNSW
jgi:hypothetical protein